ncbi:MULTISPECIES: hypothetical protein [unclassified Paenibacillus]|uniref:hypothetical protein n=1 Tax=unclassified Paenibacillus TaxID=185978 RepID=UPI001AEB6A86|nr:MULTISPECIES: hypothetical protein [unclassified Paenibacillus]MBP1154531.1 hypothetical protein [Paenibacillus sp. PvP091]MBP1170085.1 hypothetical protein [Paenibacillus sp. PvR098]MBP2441113.1 hypothetical protein [Paenibacillus sp. PvP052]
MKYIICQMAKIVDMNDEIMAEVLFSHGEYETSLLSVGFSVVSYPLGLKEFEVVHDKREGRRERFKVIDVEVDLIANPTSTRVFLEPVTLIIGQHDVGQFA